ncbi:MAG TPA: hypothetical protein DCQ98_21295 [Planctomycetaceae bacterium]|nr:hypothetical protein [Planctomycetaceae bacterium]HRF02879.1 DUF5989 family protein [Pirellulaceae bacterium]
MSDDDRTDARADDGDFESEAAEAPVSIVREFWDFLVTNKRWWLIPIALSLVVFGLLVVLAANSVLAPFLYPLF